MSGKYHTELHDILQRGRFSPVTRAKYQSVLDLWIGFAGIDPTKWTRVMAQAFYDDLCKRMQVNSANVYIASLRYVSKWYSILHNQPALDFAQIQTTEPTDKEKKKSKRHPLTQDQAAALIETCARLSPLDRRDLAMIIIGLETGMRCKSLEGATFDEIHTQPNGYPTMRVPIKGRNGDATYEVPMSDVALQSLEPWRAWLNERKVTRGPIFRRLIPGISRKAKRVYDVGESGISKVAIGNVIAQRAKSAGIIHVHPHLLRHTFVMWREQAGLEPLQIASVTGHKGPVDGVSGLASYIDMAVIGGDVRNTTPAWLRDLVARIVT